MSLIRTEWRQQPQVPVSVNPRNLLGRAVRWVGLPPFNNVSGNPTTPLLPSASVGVIATPYGRAFNFRGSGAGTFYNFTGLEFEGDSIAGNIGTLAIYAARIGAQSTNGHIWLSTLTGTTIYFQIGTAVGNNAFVFDQVLTGVGVSTIYSTKNTTLVFSSNGTAAGKQLFVNGVSRGTPDGTVPTSFAAGPKTFKFGDYAGGAGWETDADCLLALWSSEAWGVVQAQEFNRNPWQLFQPVSRNVFSLPVVAADFPTELLYQPTDQRMNTLLRM